MPRTNTCTTVAGTEFVWVGDLDRADEHESDDPARRPPAHGRARATSTHRFGEVTALDALDLRPVPAARITVLLGPERRRQDHRHPGDHRRASPRTGDVRTFGLDPAHRRRGRPPRCGVVSAKPALYDRLSGWDNLMYSAELYGLGRDAVDAAIDEAAGRFGIVEALDQQVGGYSTGMKTRLALARSVLHDPDLLLFDEPTSGLDPESAHAVLELIREMTDDGRTVVMCTHLLSRPRAWPTRSSCSRPAPTCVAGARRADRTLLARRDGAPRRRGPGPARSGRQLDRRRRLRPRRRRRRARSSSTTSAACPTSSPRSSPPACASPGSSPTTRRSRTSTSPSAAKPAATASPRCPAASYPHRPSRRWLPMSATMIEPPATEVRDPKRSRGDHEPFHVRRMLTVARTDLRQLAGARTSGCRWRCSARSSS